MGRMGKREAMAARARMCSAQDGLLYHYKTAVTQAAEVSQAADLALRSRKLSRPELWQVEFGHALRRGRGYVAGAKRHAGSCDPGLPGLLSRSRGAQLETVPGVPSATAKSLAEVRRALQRRLMNLRPRPIAPIPVALPWDWLRRSWSSRSLWRMDARSLIRRLTTSQYVIARAESWSTRFAR